MPFESPSSPEPDAAPSSPSIAPLKNTVWRPVLSCGGALGLGLALASFLVKPVATPTEKAERPEIILPVETTMIVAPSMPPGALLRGKVRLVADIVGKAPIGGAVARQVVEPGSRVKKGDSVVEISSGGSERPAPAAENLQSAAERSQIAASNAQTRLAQKINIAQIKLRAAQDRLNEAQAQVGTARDIVRRLGNGEAVPESEIPRSFRKRGAVRVKKTRVAKASPPVDRAGQIALQQAEAARNAANQGTQAVKTARQMLADAQDSVSKTASELAEAEKNVAEVEAKFDDKKASGSEVEEARARQRQAKLLAAAAERGVKTATAEVSKREKIAANLQKYADKAAGDAKSALKNVPLFPTEGENEEPDVPVGGGSATMEQAVKFASAALEESRDAAADAEKLHGEIEGYKKQTSNSSERIEETTQNLAVAQQRVLDSVPRPSFTTAVAPTDGVVTWISRLAKEVKSGDIVFGISRGAKVGASFEDKGQLWRGLKPGAMLPAFAVTAASSAPNSNKSEVRVPIQVRVTEVREPENSGDAATVECEVNNPAGTVPTAGMEVLASIPVPGQKPTLSVPSTSFISSGDKKYVAVLVPAEAGTPVPTSGAAMTATPVASSPVTSPVPSPTAPSPSLEPAVFYLEWRLVQVGRSDGLRSELVGGLSAGARVVAQPQQLIEMGYSPEPSPKPGVGGNQQPQEVSPSPVLVRLTASDA